MAAGELFSVPAVSVDAAQVEEYMKLKRIVLQNFRCFKKKELVFSPQTTLIVGPNASGKTNVLEAIYLLSTAKSFRADRNVEMIHWGEELARVTGEILNDEEAQLEVVITTGLINGAKAPKKRCLVNGVAKRQSDLVGNLYSVAFRPEDLEIVTDSPGTRRRFLDEVLSQVDREYARSLLSYEKGLRQRNKLLDFIREGEAERSQLAFWDKLLCKNGEIITKKREELIAFFNEKKSFLDTDVKTSLALYYDRSAISPERLERYKEQELLAGATLVGPHRDDFQIIQKGGTDRDLSIYGSRGEQRMAALALKLCQLEFVESIKEIRPLLLLDDIFSELDEEHRQLVSGLLGQQQTIVTMTDEEEVGGIGAEVIRLEV